MSRQVKTLISGLSLPNDRYYPNANTIVTLTDDEFQDLDPAMFTRGWLEALPPIGDLVFGATINTDASLANFFRITMTGNATLAAPTNLLNGQRVSWQVTQDATGNRVLTLASIFNLGPTTITWSTAPNKVDYLGAIYRQAANKLDVVAFLPGF